VEYRAEHAIGRVHFRLGQRLKVERAFSPFMFGIHLPGALPQAEMVRAFGALGIFAGLRASGAVGSFAGLRANLEEMVCTGTLHGICVDTSRAILRLPQDTLRAFRAGEVRFRYRSRRLDAFSWPQSAPVLHPTW